MKAIFVLALALLLGGCLPAFDLDQPATVVEAVHRSDGWSCYTIRAGDKHTPDRAFRVYSRKHYRVGDSVALVTVVEVKQ